MRNADFEMRNEKSEYIELNTSVKVKDKVKVELKISLRESVY